MKKSLKGIEEYLGTDRIISLDRKPLDKYKLNGFLVGISERLLLLQVVNQSTMTFESYAALRLKDIQSYAEESKHFATRALRVLERKPVLPERIDLSDWATFIASAQAQYPLLWFQLEKKWPGTGYVGVAVKQKRRSVTVKTVDSKAKWQKVDEAYSFKDITRVDFDNGYVNALSALIAHENLNDILGK